MTLPIYTIQIDVNILANSMEDAYRFLLEEMKKTDLMCDATWKWTNPDSSLTNKQEIKSICDNNPIDD